MNLSQQEMSDHILKLEKEQAELNLEYRLKRSKQQIKQDLLVFGCNLIASQTTSIVMAGLCGMSDGKDQERYREMFPQLGAGDTLK